MFHGIERIEAEPVVKIESTGHYMQAVTVVTNTGRHSVTLFTDNDPDVFAVKHTANEIDKAADSTDEPQGAQNVST